jgi:hypothetical protein
MKKRNIYQNQRQELLSLFEAAGSSAKGIKRIFFNLLGKKMESDVN